MEELRPKVGVGIMVIKDGMLLLGKRKGSHGGGEYSLPGGHLEYMESFQGCAEREVKEETGLEVKNTRFLGLLNNKKYDPKHYVEIAFATEWRSGEPKTLEPDKIGDWQWYSLNDLPQPHFSLLENYIEAYKTGKNYFDN